LVYPLKLPFDNLDTFKNGLKTECVKYMFEYHIQDMRGFISEKINSKLC